MTPIFLSAESVAKIHELQLERFGGLGGIREPGLLESAVAQARATYGGKPLHEFPFEMAAAYLFHIARNHPFVDGDKRTALAAALTFLHVNGRDVRMDDPSVLYQATVDASLGRLSKRDLADLLRTLAQPA
jgi:death-on-curing protein